MRTFSHSLISSSAGAFTLLELVVVLAILALVTSLAFRSLDQVEDQRRYEASREMLENIREAVLGSPNDRTTDGAHTLGGFLSDMGRLPVSRGDAMLTLQELWLQNSLPAYDVREANADNLFNGNNQDRDRDVWVPGGWRGPYLQMPLDAAKVLDGWGYSMHSPADVNPVEPTSIGYHRLRTALDAPIVSENQAIGIVRHLGANGKLGAGDIGVNRDFGVSLSSNHPIVVATVQLLDDEGNPGEITDADTITLRVYGPESTDAGKIRVTSLDYDHPDVPPIPPLKAVEIRINDSLNVTQGLRVVRASHAPSGNRSAVKHVTLRPGVNFIPLTIYRP